MPLDFPSELQKSGIHTPQSEQQHSASTLTVRARARAKARLVTRAVTLLEEDLLTRLPIRTDSSCDLATEGPAELLEPLAMLRELDQETATSHELQLVAMAHLDYLLGLVVKGVWWRERCKFVSWSGVRVLRRMIRGWVVSIESGRIVLISVYSSSWKADSVVVS